MEGCLRGTSRLVRHGIAVDQVLVGCISCGIGGILAYCCNVSGCVICWVTREQDVLTPRHHYPALDTLDNTSSWRVFASPWPAQTVLSAAASRFCYLACYLSHEHFILRMAVLGTTTE